MKLVSTLLMLFGYMLVYAATAASGKFATEPWAGLFADAYTESTDPQATTKPGAGWDPNTPPGTGGRPRGGTSVNTGRGTPTRPFLPTGPVFGGPR